MTLYSLAVKGVKDCSKRFASLLLGVLIVDGAGWKCGSLFWVSSWILPNPCEMRGLELTCFIILFLDLSIISNNVSYEIILSWRLILRLISLPAEISNSENFLLKFEISSSGII